MGISFIGVLVNCRHSCFPYSSVLFPTPRPVYESLSVTHIYLSTHTLSAQAGDVWASLSLYTLPCPFLFLPVNSGVDRQIPSPWVTDKHTPFIHILSLHRSTLPSSERKAMNHWILPHWRPVHSVSVPPLLATPNVSSHFLEPQGSLTSWPDIWTRCHSAWQIHPQFLGQSHQSTPSMHRLLEPQGCGLLHCPECLWGNGRGSVEDRVKYIVILKT